MITISFPKTRLVAWKFGINQKQIISFHLTENGGQDIASVAGWTWEFVIQKNKGAIPKLLVLTLGNGLHYEAYSSYTLVATIEAAQALSSYEGEVFAYLRRTDTLETILWGKGDFSFGNFDSQT